MDGKAESSSRQRSSNFTEEEVRCLLELVKERAEALFSKLNNSVTVERKQTLGGYYNPCERKRKDAKTDTEGKKEVVGLAIRLRSRLKKRNKNKQKTNLQVAALLPKSRVLNAKSIFHK